MFITRKELLDAYSAFTSGAVKQNSGGEIEWRVRNGKVLFIKFFDSPDKAIVRGEFNNLQSGNLKNSELYRMAEKYFHGQATWSIDYENGEANGKYRIYRPDGSLSYEAETKNNRCNGKSIHLLPNGNKMMESDLCDDERHGRYIVWDEAGSVIMEEYYDHGKMIKKVI